MNVIFHENQLGLRGTTVALYEMAHYNETILGNASYISAPIDSDRIANDKFVERFGADRILLYDDISSLETINERLDITHGYIIKAGYNDGKLIPGVKNFVHAVFDGSQPHGDCYMAVSKWLGNKHGIDYLPHIVSLPEVSQNYRSSLGIPEAAMVFGRYGGAEQFDVDYLSEAIYAAANKGIYFLLMNTAPLKSDHPNIVYLDPIIDLEMKTAFVNTCDAMIHGRTEGESFGLAICEFLHQNKPVVTNIECRDKHHIELLGDKGFYYTTANELYAILISIQKKEYQVKQLVEQFQPNIVMQKFKEVFLT